MGTELINLDIEDISLNYCDDNLVQVLNAKVLTLKKKKLTKNSIKLTNLGVVFGNLINKEKLKIADENLPVLTALIYCIELVCNYVFEYGYYHPDIELGEGVLKKNLNAQIKNYEKILLLLNDNKELKGTKSFTATKRKIPYCKKIQNIITAVENEISATNSYLEIATRKHFHPFSTYFSKKSETNISSDYHLIVLLSLINEIFLIFYGKKLKEESTRVLEAIIDTLNKKNVELISSKNNKNGTIKDLNYGNLSIKASTTVEQTIVKKTILRVVTVQNP